MKNVENWKKAYDYELDLAQNARKAGNEGMARVCARRAAGIVIGEYFRRNQILFSDLSAYDRLVYLMNMSGVSADIKTRANHLIIRVDKNHNLPIDANLIDDVSWLTEKLLG